MATKQHLIQPAGPSGAGGQPHQGAVGPNKKTPVKVTVPKHYPK